ncbi:flagellar biosynthesis protein FlhF [Ramlibacter sp. H39-3-26]|uniref:flagellar biosynthesis protein FlhF n=1 Tax=Curvibacter soli TaxID=3031331 RepID=UPI0023DA3620|nr:flagellar biosynthesis protein FlhF [Ramlibacter sp. H39-3-26]MDF1485794.1 flagellar biosynthesis protein FlhF [Ramlibacter sp. H39-3-26]
MNIKRFHAPTSREALAKARMAFGEGTLILSNRPTATGVEVVATAEDALSSLEQQAPAEQAAAQPAPRKPALAAPGTASARSAVAEDAEQLAMSTLSFQDYVRERMLRRRAEALQAPAADLSAAATPAAPAPAERPREQHAAPAVSLAPSMPAAPARHNPLRSIPMDLPDPPARKRVGATAPALAAAEAASLMGTQNLMHELHAMKDLIEERFSTLSWLGQARQDPIQSNLMLKLLRAGYSPSLARAILERIPEDIDAAGAVRWLMDVLARNVHTDAESRPIFETGGIYALVGATGVGKTTTTAKLAALCARVHGPASVGLITLDTYRVAAHEQLRTYGRMLGVVAHLAHDRAALQDLLGLLAGKKMVLIDTTGIAPRDPRKRDMLDVLDLPNVKRLLVLNAGSHGDTIDDMVGAFKSTGAQQTILSKIDEAVKLGPALDAVIRHQLLLRGVTNGQRVPEDWDVADAQELVRMSMRSPAKSAFDPKASDLNFIFSQTPDAARDRGLVDA